MDKTPEEIIDGSLAICVTSRGELADESGNIVRWAVSVMKFTPRHLIEMLQH